MYDLIFFVLHPQAIYNTNRLYRLDYLMKKYKVLVVTNNPKYIIKKYNGQIKVYGAPNINIKKLNKLLYLLSIFIITLLNQSKGLFFTQFESIALCWFKRTKILHLDVHPYQMIDEKDDTKTLNIYKNIYLKIIIFSFKQSNFIISVSRQLSDLCIYNGISKSIIFYVPQGADVNKIIISTHNSLLNSSMNIIYMGGVHEDRGLYLLLELIQYIINSKLDIKFELVGASPEYLGIIKSAIPRYEEKTNIITINGIIPFEELSSHLIDKDIGISLLEPTLYYGYSPPQKIYEYFAAGLCIIANDLPTHTDYISHLNNGIIIGYDSDSLINAIVNLYNDRRKLELLKKNSYAESNNYNIQALEDLLDNIFNKVFL